MIKVSLAVVTIAAAAMCASAWPQQTIIETPGAEAYSGVAFDRTDELKITGQIEKVEDVGAARILWVRAKTVDKQGFGVRPGTTGRGAGFLWRIEGEGPGKVKDPAKLVAGAKVAVTGYNSSDKSCKPTCRLSAEKVTVK